MSATDFPWLRPRTVGLDAHTLAQARKYAAEHSLPGDDGPSPEVRSRVLDAIHTLPVLPCEADEDGPDIDCLTCEDTGETHVGDFRYPMPCPDCHRGDWTWRQELADDARYGK